MTRSEASALRELILTTLRINQRSMSLSARHAVLAEAAAHGTKGCEVNSLSWPDAFAFVGCAWAFVAFIYIMARAGGMR